MLRNSQLTCAREFSAADSRKRMNIPSHKKRGTPTQTQTPEPNLCKKAEAFEAQLLTIQQFLLTASTSLVSVCLQFVLTISRNWILMLLRHRKQFEFFPASVLLSQRLYKMLLNTRCALLNQTWKSKHPLALSKKIKENLHRPLAPQPLLLLSLVLHQPLPNKVRINYN